MNKRDPNPPSIDGAPVAPSTPAALTRLSHRLAVRAAEHGLRRLRTVDGAGGVHLVVDRRPLLSFASNDYLGLAAHPALREAAIACVARDGIGATAAHLVGGHRTEHAALEAELAEFCGRPRALLFSTGYAANLGIAQALIGAGDSLVEDKLNHASLIDAATLSGAKLRRYLHADVASASRQLAAAEGASLLSTDGVFSMDGDVAPLAGLADAANAAGSTLVVDDAHGFGVLGRDGRGSIDAAGLDLAGVPVYMATLGKALGVGGAFVAGSAELIEGLVQFARTYVYTTAMPPALAAATRTALKVLRYEPWRRDRLGHLIAQFHRGAAARGIPLLPSMTPIQPVRIGSSPRALAVSRRLEAAGFFVPAIRPPTVPKGQARLRVTLSAAHTEREVEALLTALEAALEPTRKDEAGDGG